MLKQSKQVIPLSANLGEVTSNSADSNRSHKDEGNFQNYFNPV